MGLVHGVDEEISNHRVEGHGKDAQDHHGDDKVRLSGNNGESRGSAVVPKEFLMEGVMMSTVIRIMKSSIIPIEPFGGGGGGGDEPLAMMAVRHRKGMKVSMDSSGLFCINSVNFKPHSTLGDTHATERTPRGHPHMALPVAHADARPTCLRYRGGSR